MKRIIYKVMGFMSEYDPETEEVVQKEVLSSVNIPYCVENEERAKTEAYNGEYIIEDDTERIVAPRNILADEYITVNGVLYKATENIPNGEPIIVGQNAYETTIEAQLADLAKGE